jgi:DNA-binding transcriptional regulator GbsR (MarR family)
MENEMMPMGEKEVIDQFVDAWGAMGSFWGVNRSVARVHALLLASSRPWTLDEISERLRISKGNASTSLKELRSWNVVRKIFKPGERKEFFLSEPDAWQMFFSIVRERKRREFDPILASLREAMALAGEAPREIDINRLTQLEQMLATFESLAGRLLSSEERAKALISLFEGKL